VAQAVTEDVCHLLCGVMGEKPTGKGVVMYEAVVSGVVLVAALFVLVTGCGLAEEAPVEEAEQEAGIEEVERLEETAQSTEETRDIATEGGAR
jgi:hypothetical protein